MNDETKPSSLPDTAVKPVEPPLPAEPQEAETETEEVQPQKTWIENFSVKEVKDIETVDRLTVKVGINEYKGQMLVFLAKVTDKEFSRQFFSMPAYIWEKAIPVLQEYIPRIAEVEKKVMAENVERELLRLKELGIDVGAIARKIAKAP